MVRMVRRGIDRLVGLTGPFSRLLFPPRCALCGADLTIVEEDVPLCDDCRARLGVGQWAGCPRCGAATTSTSTAEDCRLCRKAPLKFDAVIPLGEYKDELRKVVLRMKRPQHESLAAAMAGLLAAWRGEQLTDLHADIVVSVPMHWTRRIRRGVNSPEILANCLGRALRTTVKRRVLVRRRNTLPQANLSPRQRFRNVRGAFRVPARYNLEDMRVLLVDDILTTGATCSEAAGALKQAGAAMVAAVVIARAQGPG